MNKNLAAALWYASKGWPIFPIKYKTKIPLTEHGFKDASTNQDKINEWWGETPNANIALATGKLSETSILDLDPRNGSAETIIFMGLLRPSMVSMTGGGGSHWFYKYNPAFGASCKLGQGLDFKSDGGYILLPPSIHPNGKPYYWQERDMLKEFKLDPIPDIFHQIKKSEKASFSHKPKGWVSEALKSLKDGSRHDVFCKIIAKLNRANLTPEETFDLLLPHAEKCKFPEGEFRKEVFDVCARYQQKKEKDKTPWKCW